MKKEDLDILKSEMYHNRMDPSQMEDWKVLQKFSVLISDQLPKMPKDYIAKIVFDPYHQSILIKDKTQNDQLIGGICFRVFEVPRLIEIVFLTIDLRYQQRGYGSYLIRQLKAYMKSSREQFQFIIACADDNAVEFFKKHGFSDSPQIEDILYKHYTKEYEGSKKMACLVDYRTDPHKIVERIKSLLDQESSSYKISTEQWRILDSIQTNQEKIDYLKRLHLIPYSTLYNHHQIEKSFTDKIEYIYDQITKDDYKDLFMEIVKKENMPEYFEVIKEPMCFSIIKSKLYKYRDIEEFERDVMLIVGNAKKYNNQLTIFHQRAIKLQKQFTHLKNKIFGEQIIQKLLKFSYKYARTVGQWIDCDYKLNSVGQERC